MESPPRVFEPQFAESMKREAEQLLKDVMKAVNDAPDGDWIEGSEEQVRDRLAVFRQRVFEAALQARIDAAPSRFSPLRRRHRSIPSADSLTRSGRAIKAGSGRRD